MQQENNKMCLRIITPVNIGDGTILGVKDYLYDESQQIIYFLNLSAWHKFIYEHGLLTKYEAYLQNFREKQNLLNWLKAQGYTLQDVQGCITCEAVAEVNKVKTNVKQTLNDVHRHVQQVDGSLYVPGSSIKGVFRTAILYKLLLEKPAVARKYWNEIQVEMQKPNFKPKFLNKLTDAMEKELLHKLQLESGGAVRSSLRGLQMSDTYASKNMQIAVLQKIDVVFDKYGKASSRGDLPIFRECILPETELYFDLKLDKAMLATVGISSIEELLDCVQDFFYAVMRLLEDAFGDDCPQLFRSIEGANMFLGSNTGFLSKTLLALLAPNDEAAKNTIKAVLDKSFKMHKHLLRDKIISPRTLKCTTYKGELVLMGLVEVSKA